MARERKRRLMGEINVVPYIDVMLVLLIIFMVTAPLLTQGVKVDLPNADAEPLENEEFQEPLILSVDANGGLYLNVGDDEETLVEPETVVARTAAVLRRRPETAILVRADANVSHGNVVTAMVLLQSAGAGKVGIVTEPGPEPVVEIRQ